MFDAPPKKSHRLQVEPSISLRTLADYMAASHQVRRTLLRNSKYQPIVRVTQHNRAKATISNWIGENRPISDLVEKVAQMRDSFFDDEFSSETNQHNCDYIDSFISAADTFELPEAEYLPDGETLNAFINGTRVRITPQLRLRRITKNNSVKIGALFLRYQKNQALPDAAGIHQSAFIYGYLRENPFEQDAKPEHQLCLTLDCVAGIAHQPPTDKAVYLYKEMAAECASIAERWGSISPPPGATF